MYYSGRVAEFLVDRFENYRRLPWENYQPFSEGYKRIRAAYIDVARDRPDEFKKRLENFINKTHDNKIIKGFGGIGKYYREL